MTDFSIHEDHKGLISDYDLYLLGQGKHEGAYEKLGAHPCSMDGVEGVNFAVWAPNAREVSVIGDFNDWNPKANYLWKFQENGIWETFVPGAKVGMLYKYLISTDGQEAFEKCDPYAFACECPPKTACRIVDQESYEWNDDEWVNERRGFDWQHRPISVYEVHLGSWQKEFAGTEEWLNYREIAQRLVPYVKKMNFTHIELLPVCEHPFTGSWGYQVTGYYAPTARYGSPDDFKYLVDLCHQNGIGVILDWVPAHFPKDAKGLGRFDGTPLYEHEDPRQGEHLDWGTYIFNYGRNEVRNFLVANALFWIDKYHVDGLRVDAVASMLYLDYSRKEGEWIPNRYGGRENIEAIEFLREMNREVQTRFPGVLTVAEESTAWPGVTMPGYAGGLGFCLKWNMGWMHDTLAYMKNDPIFRKYHHDQLTFSILYSFNENFLLPFSHDEVVHCKGSMIGKMAGDVWQKCANLRLLYSYLWTHPGKKLLFMGGEFGQWSEWKDNSQLDWNLLEFEPHQGIQRCVSDLGKLYETEPALYELDFKNDGFQWIDCSNRDISTLSFIRRGIRQEDYLVVVLNFTPNVRHDFWVGVPEKTEFQEIFNSDSRYYGGSNVANGRVFSEPKPCQGFGNSIRITLPPLAAVVFRPIRH
ncbi:MAG: 1,4-alpha-glucan branching protein GlgB [Planctomycetaceae bacterium]|nr:1,4-alpha-glucan branching protein GlgB [Planctomycetaceae bacterium]